MSSANINTGFALIHHEQIRQIQHEGRMHLAVVDLVEILTETTDPADYWTGLKAREPQLERLVHTLFGDEFVTLAGAMRVVQAIPTARAERIKRWLAESGLQRVEEQSDPELAILRARRQYEAQGRSRRWIDKRLRGISARQELTSEWAHRGAADSEQYRELTNRLMEGAFGMDVQKYREFKNLAPGPANLRDHMSELELVLTTLSETTATTLSRSRESSSFAQLLEDVKDAGEIVANTRRAIEAKAGKALVTPRSQRAA